jgi:hypothetical protein
MSKYDKKKLYDVGKLKDKSKKLDLSPEGTYLFLTADSRLKHLESESRRAMQFLLNLVEKLKQEGTLSQNYDIKVK